MGSEDRTASAMWSGPKPEFPDSDVAASMLLPSVFFPQSQENSSSGLTWAGPRSHEALATTCFEGGRGERHMDVGTTFQLLLVL
jgi:hypothetical protein